MTIRKRGLTREEERKDRKEMSGLKGDKHELNNDELNVKNVGLKEAEKSHAQKINQRLRRRLWKRRTRIMRLKMK